FTQSRCKSSGPWTPGRGVGAYDPDHGQLARLLRARRERPRGRCPAEQCDELASFQLMEMHPIPSRAGSTSQGYRMAEDQAAGIGAVHNLMLEGPGRAPGVSPTRLDRCPLRSESDRGAALPQSVAMCHDRTTNTMGVVDVACFTVGAELEFVTIISAL